MLSKSVMVGSGMSSEVGFTGFEFSCYTELQYLGIQNLNSINLNKTQDLQPLDIESSYNGFDEHVSCPPTNVELKMDAHNTKTHVKATIGVVATGSLLPPKLDDFYLVNGRHPASMNSFPLFDILL